MIITRTPYRISLFGGGTDFPEWYETQGGAVLSFTINRYCYISARILPPFFDHSYRVSYSVIETTKSIDEIKHPAVRESLRHYLPSEGVEIHHHGDLPARSGVGSSSSFAVGLIHALKLLARRTDVSKKDLADDAIFLEQKILNEVVGSQDQIACSFGGVNFISFHPGRKPWSIDPIRLSPERIREIQERMVLVFSGISRSSSDVSKTLVKNFSKKTIELERTFQLANLGRQLLTHDNDLDGIGDLLNESWELKKNLNPQSVNAKLLAIYENAIKLGATGGKILGAGGGGFMLFWIPEGGKRKFIEHFKSGMVVPFQIDNQGTTCILNS